MEKALVRKKKECDLKTCLKSLKKALAEKAIADNKRINGAVELNGSMASLTPSKQSSNI